MSTLNSLLREIICHPDDDVARLAFADALEELPTVSRECPKCVGSKPLTKRPGWIWVGQDNLKWTPCNLCGKSGVVTDTSNQDRAEFIRVQCEIARYPKRKKITCMGCEPIVLKHEFDDHYSYTELNPNEVEAGDRIDFLAHVGLKKPKWVYGLKVVKKVGEGIERRVIVRKDAESVQCPSDKLREREEELLIGRWHTWFSALDRLPTYCDNLWPKDHDYFRRCVFSRGFVSSITCTAADFLKHADDLVWNEKQTIGGHWIGDNQQTPVDWAEEERRPCPDTAHPIRKVVLTTAPEVHLQRYDGSGPLATIDGIKANYQPHYESVPDMIKELFRREFGEGIEFKLSRLMVETREGAVLEAGEVIQAGTLLTVDDQGRAISARARRGNMNYIVGIAARDSEESPPS